MTNTNTEQPKMSKVILSTIKKILSRFMKYVLCILAITSTAQVCPILASMMGFVLCVHIKYMVANRSAVPTIIVEDVDGTPIFSI